MRLLEQYIFLTLPWFWLRKECSRKKKNLRYSSKSIASRKASLLLRPLKTQTFYSWPPLDEERYDLEDHLLTNLSYSGWHLKKQAGSTTEKACRNHFLDNNCRWPNKNGRLSYSESKDLPHCPQWQDGNISCFFFFFKIVYMNFFFPFRIYILKNLKQLKSKCTSTHNRLITVYSGATNKLSECLSK